MMKILVVDDVADIREIVTLMLEACFEVTVKEAINGNEAINILKAEPDIACVICDYNMPNGTGEDVYRYLLDNQLKIPFVLCSSSRPTDHAFFKTHPPTAFVVKPELFPILTDTIRPIIQASTLPEFVRIRKATVLRHGLLSFDLYVKMNDKKFVKVMLKGDQFDSADFAKYEAKHIEFLYCKTEDARQLLERMIADLNQIVVARPPSTFEQGLQISTAAMEVISDFNRTLGFSPEVQKLTKESIQLTVQMIRKTPKIAQLYSKITLDPDSFLASHSTVLAYLSCGLASLMGWTSDSTFYKLSMAAFLHDLTLHNELSKIDSLKELALIQDRFTVEEQETYSRHPAEAAELSNAISEVPADVHSILFQHHERPDGSGFPQGINYDHIQPLSALFIVSESLITFRHQISMSENLALFLSSLDPVYRRGNFRQVIEAIAHAMPDKRS